MLQHIVDTIAQDVNALAALAPKIFQSSQTLNINKPHAFQTLITAAKPHQDGLGGHKGMIFAQALATLETTWNAFVLAHNKADGGLGSDWSKTAQIILQTKRGKICQFTYINHGQTKNTSHPLMIREPHTLGTLLEQHGRLPLCNSTRLFKVKTTQQGNSYTLRAPSPELALARLYTLLPKTKDTQSLRVSEILDTTSLIAQAQTYMDSPYPLETLT